MNFRFSAEEESFRAEVVEFLRDHRDLDAFFLQGHKWEKVRELFRAMGHKGWLSLGWPVSAGGSGKPLSYEYILWDEVAYARAARNPLAPGIVAKTIARYGSEEQVQRWLPPIRSGELHFSLGYSEPEAGSDLASVRCRAERKGDVYVVTGQKCWQSYAQDMDYLWLLCRTGSQESRGRGLTLLIVDLASPGVKIGALPTLDGDQLNEVHLDDVEVNACSTRRIATSSATAQAAPCMANSSPPNARVTRCSWFSSTSSEKCGFACGWAAAARMSACIGLSRITPQVDRGWPTRRASCSTSTVSRPARPGVTILGPPLKPAKKCGSTKPVVSRTSASVHSRLRKSGTPSPTDPRSTRASRSRATWLITRQVRAISGPSMASSSSGEFARWVPVAIRIVRSSGRRRPSSSSSIASSTSRRGWARVMSQTETATRAPGATTSRRRGPATGERIASCSASRGAGWASSCCGTTTVASSGTSTSRPSLP